MRNVIRMIRSVALVGLLATGPTSPARAESPPLWGKLTPGPYAAGFVSGWQLDYSRRYNTTFDDKKTYATGKAPRPILINKWYPATSAIDAKRMPHCGYLEIQSSDRQLASFSTKLAEYNRAVIAKEIMGKPAGELTDQEKLLLGQFLDTPTSCIRSAPPAEGKFPL